jgi:hypothetical protein
MDDTGELPEDSDEFAEDHFDDEDTVDVAGALGSDGRVDSNADPGL